MAELSFIQDSHTRSMISIGYTAIDKLELWDWLKTYEPESGFMFSSHPNINRIMQKMESLPDPPGHSGCSFGITMRQLEYIAKEGLDQYKVYVTSPREE